MENDSSNLRKGKPGKRLSSIVIPVAGAVMVVFFIVFRSGILTAPPQAGDFTLETLQGERVTLTDYLGQPVVLNFFLSRCPDCNKEAPVLNELFEKYHNSQGLVVLGVGVGQEIEDFVERNQITYPVLVDVNMTVARLYEIGRVPHTVFIDRQGRIVREQVELIPRDDLEQYIQHIL